MFICKSVKSETRQYKYKITQTLRISSHSDAFSFTFRDNLYYLYMIIVFLFLVGCLGFPCPSVLCLFVCVCVYSRRCRAVHCGCPSGCQTVSWYGGLVSIQSFPVLFHHSQSHSITPNPIQSVQSCLSIFLVSFCDVCFSLCLSLFSIFFYLVAN